MEATVDPVPTPVTHSGTFLDKIRDGLKVFLEIAGLLVALCRIVKEHWKFFGSLAITAIVYAVIAFYTLYYPSRTITSFYGAVEDKRYDDAWALVFQNYRDQRWSSEQNFANGFRTTVGYTDMSVTYPGHLWNPINVVNTWLYGVIAYDVTFTVRDRFTQDDFGLDEQQYDLLWLHIANPKDFDALHEGRLPWSNSNTRPALELSRTYKKQIEVRRKTGWVISHIENVSEGLAAQKRG